MSVGHVAREVESAGIPTVSVFVRAFLPVAERMGLPRVVVTRHPMGRPLGAPGDGERQRATVETAIALLESATSGGSIVELPWHFRPGSVSPGD